MESAYRSDRLNGRPRHCPNFTGPNAFISESSGLGTITISVFNHATPHRHQAQTVAIELLQSFTTPPGPGKYHIQTICVPELRVRRDIVSRNRPRNRRRLADVSAGSTPQIPIAVT